jgi:GT2 family glycosyltransferase
MDKYNNVGVLMPKVCLPNGEIQYTAKLLPTPFDFIVRRFVPLAIIRNYFEKKFELRNSGYNKIMDVPFLSGCFMMFKTTLYKSIGGFDENIFMYTEDVDICRRVILSQHRAVFFPRVHIYHDFKKKSFLNFSVFKIYFKSAVYYFNKWGWLFDNDRKNINKYTLSQFRKV